MKNVSEPTITKAYKILKTKHKLLEDIPLSVICVFKGKFPTGDFLEKFPTHVPESTAKKLKVFNEPGLHAALACQVPNLVQLLA